MMRIPFLRHNRQQNGPKRKHPPVLYGEHRSEPNEVEPMNRQAIILQLRSKSAIILSENHEYLRIRRAPGMAIGQTIRFDSKDLVWSTSLWEGLNMKKKDLTIAASLILVVAVGFVFARYGLQKPQNGFGPAATQTQTETIQGTGTPSTETHQVSREAVAMLAIDINPSVRLMLDGDGLVLEAIAINDDAEQLDLEALVGLTADAAVERVVEEAIALGFIDPDDFNDDFVVLTHSAFGSNDHEPLMQTIQTRLLERTGKNTQLQNVEMVMVRATEQEMNQAQQDRTGVGLMIMNRLSVQAGLDEAKTVREFFANQERLALMQQGGYMWQGQYGPEGATGQGIQATVRETTGTAKQGEDAPGPQGREGTGTTTGETSGTGPNGPGNGLGGDGSSPSGSSSSGNR
jgi:hypothetical protein